VELAALLYTGEYIHARHVWRRWKENNPSVLLQDWWRVGAAMIESDPDTLWKGLAHIQSHHPAPLNAYAAEVGTAYRIRLLQRFPASTSTSTSTSSTRPPYLALLNVASPAELEQFCNEHGVGPNQHHHHHQYKYDANAASHTDTRTGLSQVVAFLESAHPANSNARPY
jgi:hypothetical protein